MTTAENGAQVPAPALPEGQEAQGKPSAKWSPACDCCVKEISPRVQNVGHDSGFFFAMFFVVAVVVGIVLHSMPLAPSGVCVFVVLEALAVVTCLALFVEGACTWHRYHHADFVYKFMDKKGEAHIHLRAPRNENEAWRERYLDPNAFVIRMPLGGGTARVLYANGNALDCVVEGVNFLWGSTGDVCVDLVFENSFHFHPSNDADDLKVLEQIVSERTNHGEMAFARVMDALLLIVRDKLTPENQRSAGAQRVREAVEKVIREHGTREQNARLELIKAESSRKRA